MKRQVLFTAIFIGAISGCVSTDSAPETGGVRPHYGKSFGPPTVPGVEGPYGTKVPMSAPYNMAPPGNQYAAASMMSQNIPMNLVQMNPMMGRGAPGMPPTMSPGGMILSPPGVPGMPGMPGGSPFGPGGMPTPGMPPMPGGMPNNPFMKTNMEKMMPDAGVMNANIPPGLRQPGGVLPTQFASSPPVGSMFPAQRTQVQFGNPVRMKVYWFTQGPDGKPNYSTTALETPGRYNFAQGAIYRLKLTNIPGRPALELYPTLEVVPTGPKTNEFLAHNSVPLDFSEDDFKQVVDRNYIVKVIYLPDPQFQDAAGAGPGEITSTQLEPGQDPIQEALRRGSILLVLRIGNIDQGLISSPPTNAPIPGGPPMMQKPPYMGVPPGVQIPFNMPPITPGGPVPPGMIPPGAAPPGFVPPGMIPPGAIPPGAIPPGAIPPGAPIGGGFGPTPPGFGGGGVPNTLTIEPKGKEIVPNAPLDLKNPPPLPPAIGPLAPPNKNPEEAKPANVPGLPIPPTTEPKTEKQPIPPLPVPMPGETMNREIAPMLPPPVIPASKETAAPGTLPAPPSLPLIGPGAGQLSLPAMPELPERK